MGISSLILLVFVVAVALVGASSLLSLPRD